MKAGEVDAIIIGNPVPHTSGWDLENALSSVEEVIHLSTYNDETSKASWHLSRAHFLEAGGWIFFWWGQVGYSATNSTAA